MDLGLADATAVVVGRIKALLDKAAEELSALGSPDALGVGGRRHR
jgi:hypothetical protein